MKKVNLLVGAMCMAVFSFSQAVSNFQNLTLAPNSYWNGSDTTDGFSSGNAFFENSYNQGLWSGFAYSDVTDNTTPGPGNQYSSIAGGYNGSPNYAVVHDTNNTVIRLTGNAQGRGVAGFMVTNSTYAYLYMLNGIAGNTADSAFTNDDWLELSVTGWYQGSPVEDTVDFYLAYDSFYDADTPNFYPEGRLVIVDNWQWVDLRPLGNIDSLTFSLTSSRDTDGGTLPPAFFCMANLITSDIFDQTVTVNYEQDTVVSVVQYDADSSNGPFTVQIVGSPTIDGSSALVDSINEIWYIPTISVVAVDTVTYLVCNSLNQCDTGQIFFNVIVPSSVPMVSVQQSNIYPNPFSNSFAISHSGVLNEVRLYDLEGRLVQTVACNRGDNVTQVNAANLASGTYFVRLIMDDGTAVSIVIKQ